MTHRALSGVRPGPFSHAASPEATRSIEIIANDIVVHCKVGGRSAQAYEVLQQAGYTRIKNLKGGILAWADQVDRSMQKY